MAPFGGRIKRTHGIVLLVFEHPPHRPDTDFR